jgi:hypothetical protein
MEQMSYQEAAKIRKSGLSDLIASKLMSDQSIGEALKTSIDMKLKARAKGLKEKFDILNIARIMTGGSGLGPALIGKLLGREREDVEYFAKTKGKRSKKDKASPASIKPIAPSLKPVEENKEESPLFTTIGPGRIMPVRRKDSAANILAKLYNLLKKSYEDKKLESELNEDFAQERKIENEARHKELINALLGLKITKDMLASPAEDGGGLLGGIAAVVGTEVGGKLLTKGGKKVAEKVAARSVTKGAEKVAAKVATKTAQQIATEAVKKYGKNVVIEESQLLDKAGNPLRGAARNARIRKLTAESALKIAEKQGGKSVAKFLVKKIPFVGLVAGLGFGIQRALEGDFTGAGLEVGSGVASIFPGIGTAASIAIDVGLAGRDLYSPTATLAPDNTDTNTTTTDTTESTTPIQSSPSFTIGSISSPVKQTASAAPSMGSPVGQRVVAATRSNNDYKLQAKNTSPTVLTDNKTVNIGGKNSTTSMGIPASVRTDESTFTRSLRQETRIV